MSGPFLALMGDVPRRLARGKILWIILVVIVVFQFLFAGMLGAETGTDGVKYITWFGKDPRPDPGAQGGGLSLDPAMLIREWLGGLFGIFFACYAGVTTGLFFLADAVTSAFAPGSAEMNVPKPVHRGTIIIARHSGAVFVAAAFATFLVGGATSLGFLRTGEWAGTVLFAVPASLLMFGMLHAIGTLFGMLSRNAFLAAFLPIVTWVVSWLTEKLGTALPKFNIPMLDTVGQVSRILHRVLPRAADLPDLAERLIEKKLGDPTVGGTSGELELVLQCLAWWGVALGLSVLVVRRRDF